MQIVWNSQNNEKLYAIDETALYNKIKGKSRSAKFKLNFVELTLISSSIFVVFIPFLKGTTILKGSSNALDAANYVLMLVYLVLGIYTLLQRFKRTREERGFERSMLGELNKAIWRVDRLMHYGKQIMVYLVPVCLSVSAVFFLSDRFWLGIGFIVCVVAVALFGIKWELKKIHLPNRQSLETLRETLTADIPSPKK